MLLKISWILKTDVKYLPREKSPLQKDYSGCNSNNSFKDVVWDFGVYVCLCGGGEGEREGEIFIVPECKLLSKFPEM